MEVFAGMAFLVWVAVIGVPISLVLLAWCAYYRLKGMERALWAVVSQLQALRHEEHGPVQTFVAGEAVEVPAPAGSISLSMFGR